MPCHWTGKGSTHIIGNNSDHPTKHVNLTTTTNPLPMILSRLSFKLLVLLVLQIFGRDLHVHSSLLIELPPLSKSYLQKAVRLLELLKLKISKIHNLPGKGSPEFLIIKTVAEHFF